MLLDDLDELIDEDDDDKLFVKSFTLDATLFVVTTLLLLVVVVLLVLLTWLSLFMLAFDADDVLGGCW